MELFKSFIEILVTMAVLLTTVRMYLQVNKLWKRKHEQVVADSISIIANTLGSCVHLPFIARFLLIDNNIPAAINSTIILIGLTTMSCMGTGFWVRSNKGTSFFRLLLRSLNLERKESGDLAKALLRPRGVNKIITILRKLAAIDNHIDKTEIEMIDKFTNEWDIEPLELTPGPVEEVTSLADLRSSTEDYLDLSPPNEQAAAVGDLMKLLIEADGQVKEEERLIYGELRGMIDNYVSQDNEDRIFYEVLVVPQNEKQIEAIHEVLPNVKAEMHRGGQVFVAGKFFSRDYAEAMCEKYISLGLFSVIEDHDPVHPEEEESEDKS